MSKKQNNQVTLEREEEVSLVSLNDQGSINSLSEKLLKELFDALKEADKDGSTKVLVLRGTGRGFSAGHNLKEVQENQNESFYRDLFNSSKKVMTIFLKPTALYCPVITLGQSKWLALLAVSS